MSLLGDMIVRIVGDNAQFDNSIDKSGAKYDAFLGKLEKGGKTLSKFVTAPLLAAAGAAVKFAIDADETAAKFGTAFRDVRKEADKTAQNLRDNYGMSTEEAQRLLAGTGDLLKGFGASGAEALSLSTKVQQLSVDLASYNNLAGGSADASSRITRALLGERDALIGVGVKITETAVEAERLARGTKDLTGQAKLFADAQITLDLIMKQSQDAMGDFARTSQSGANQLRVLKARTSELLVTFGQQMLPTVTKMVQKIITLFEGFANLSDSTKGFIITMGGLVAAIGPLMLITAKLITVFQVLRTAVIAAMIALKAMDAATKTSVAGLALAGVGLLIGAIVGFSRETKTATKETELWDDSLKSTGERAVEVTETLRRLMGEQKQFSIQALQTQIDQLEADKAAEMAKGANRDIGKIARLALEIGGLEKRLEALGSRSFSGQTNDALKLIAEGFAIIDQKAKLATQAGEEYNAIEEKHSLLLKQINDLLDKGFAFESEAVQTLIGKHAEYLKAIEDETKATDKRDRKKGEGINKTYQAFVEATQAELEASQAKADVDRMRIERQAQLVDAVEKEITRMTEEEEAKRVKAAEEAAQRKIQIQGMWLTSVSNMINALSSLVAAQYEAEIDAAEGNDAEIRRIKRDQAKASRMFALFDIGMKTAQAIVGFLANPGGIAGIGLSIAAGIIGALQAGAVLAQPLPALASGGVVMPTTGGTALIAGEAGVAEAIFPLDRLGEILATIPNAVGIGSGESMIHLQVNMDSAPILEKIFPATQNGRILIDARAVV